MCSFVVDETTQRARQLLTEKKYRYLGGDDVYKHKDNIDNIIKWSNATPLKGYSKKGFECHFCNRCFDFAKKLKAHTKVAHKLSLAKLHLKHTLQWTLRLDITDLECEICKEKLTKVENLLVHLKTHDKVVHTDVKNQIIPYSFPNNKFQCLVCNKNFNSFKPQTDHMIQHYKIYECGDCGKGFLSKKNLTRHIVRHRLGEFKCSFCNKEFANRELMMNHERLLHKRSDARVKGKEVQCDVCERVYPSHFAMMKHKSRVHLKEYKFRCVFCDKGFFVKAELEDHEVMHTKERRFECMLCPKTYPRRKGLVEHMRVHADDRRFRCDRCGMRFIKRQTLLTHVAKKHKLDDL